jgi:hypothetical protein
MPKANLAAIKEQAWYARFGPDTGRTKCPVCLKNEITQLQFHCGHIVAEACGGDTCVDNLVPICSNCNTKCGKTNLHEYTKCVFGRDLVLPNDTYEPVKKEIIISDAVKNFISNEFVFKDSVSISRKRLVEMLSSAVKGSKFTVEECYEFLKTYGIDVEYTVSLRPLNIENGHFTEPQSGSAR